MDEEELGLPRQFTIERFDDYIHISRKWFGARAIFFIAFAIIWNTVLFTFFHNNDEQTVGLLRFLPLIHVAVGIGLIYYAIASILNKTDIFVSKEKLEVSHKPVPWLGNKTLDAKDIKQLYSKERISRNSNNNSNTVSYEIHVIGHSGSDTTLLKSLETSQQALYAEQEIEKFLGIKNKPVRGEI
jgi:hypothetical protein